MEVKADSVQSPLPRALYLLLANYCQGFWWWLCGTPTPPKFGQYRCAGQEAKRQRS